MDIHSDEFVCILLAKITEHVKEHGLVDLAYHLKMKSIATITMWLRRETIPESRREDVAKFFGLSE